MKNDIIKYKKFIDLETGEEIEIPIIKNQKQNRDFQMIFYGYLEKMISILGNKKIKVLKELIENRIKEENIYKGGNIKNLALNSNVSYPTALEAVKELERENLLKRKNGFLKLNAELICDGRFKNRIMHEF